jgi:hypothetical protein
MFFSALRLTFALIVVGALAAPASASAVAAPLISSSSPCLAGTCHTTVTYAPDLAQIALVEIDWDHTGAPAEGFQADAAERCIGLGALDPLTGLLPVLPVTCSATSAPYGVAHTTSIVVRVTLLAAAPTFSSQRLTVLDQGRSEPTVDSCQPRRAGEQCGPGKGRQTAGGGAKVSHKGWPAITGILWQILDSGHHQKTGGADNDELLGHHGNEVIHGGAGKDVIWGDWDPKNNNTHQIDQLFGEAGNDWIYSSHGHNTIRGGGGKDYIWAYYGVGSIDCGAGFDTLRIKVTNGYRVRNCERIKNFCSFGSKPGNQGGCYKPGERVAGESRR